MGDGDGDPAYAAAGEQEGEQACLFPAVCVERTQATFSEHAQTKDCPKERGESARVCAALEGDTGVCYMFRSGATTGSISWRL